LQVRKQSASCKTSNHCCCNFQLRDLQQIKQSSKIGGFGPINFGKKLSHQTSARSKGSTIMNSNKASNAKENNFRQGKFIPFQTGTKNKTL
jgi:hypothetical protein